MKKRQNAELDNFEEKDDPQEKAASEKLAEISIINANLESKQRRKSIDQKYSTSVEPLGRQQSYHKLFKDIEDPGILKDADDLNVKKTETGKVIIESSISKSSKAIDNLIDFKSIKAAELRRQNSSNRVNRVSMDPLAYTKMTTTSKEPEPISLGHENKPLIPASDTDDIGRSNLEQQRPKPPRDLPDREFDQKFDAIKEVEDENGVLEVEKSDGQSPQQKLTKTKLLELCQKGEWGVVDQLLRGYDQDSPLPHMKDPITGETPLMFACKDNRLVTVDRLLAMSVYIDECDKDQRTALHYAAQYSKDDIAKLLLSKKADANITGSTKGNLPLHLACARTVNTNFLVNSLLKATKNGRLQMDNDGSIPLIYAVQTGSLVNMKELLAKEATTQLSLLVKATGDAAIHIACRRKDLEALKLICDAGGSINIQNAAGQTALHLCAENGDENIVKYLYTLKANATILDNMDRSVLHMAAEKGHTKIVEFLIDKFKCNVLTRDVEGNTLMHITSLSGHPETTMSFLKRGVPLHMPNKEGSLCIHAAAQRGHVNVVKTLLDKGANMNARTKDLYTPLHIAVKYGNPAVVETLIGHGAEVNVKGGLFDESPLHIAAQLKGGEKCAEMLLKSGADVNEIMQNGETSLHIAARNGNLEMLKSLMDEGASPMLVCLAGNSPLHIAVRYCHLVIVTELLAHVSRTMSRVDVVLLVNMRNKEGETPIHFAAELVKKRTHTEFEDVDIIRALLEYDGDLNVATKFTQETPIHYCASAGNSDILQEMVNYLDYKMTQAANKQAKNGWSPLLFASNHGHDQIATILLKCSARVDVFDDHGMTALHLACEKGHKAVAEVLLRNKAFVNAKSKSGLTPLHLAAQFGFKELVEILVKKYKASVDAVTLNRKTPLHLAAQYGQREVCQALLFDKQNAADPNAIDSKHQTPMHLAAKNDHSAVVKLFLKFKPELLTRANTDGMTCAHIAAANGSFAVIKEFMRFNKAIIHGMKNKTNGSTPLHLAAEGGHYKVVKILVDMGASPAEENDDGMTCLHLAAKYGYIDLLQYLKSKMSLKIISKKTGMTPLHVAAHYGQIEFVREMLVDAPANIKSDRPKTGEQIKDLLTESGLTPLHLAAQSGHENIVRLLLNCIGVDVECQTKNNGSIPLHFSAENGHTNITSLLLSKSPTQISKKDNSGRTALHLAASHGHLEIATLLLGQGSEINAIDNNNFTALHFAARSGYLRMCKLLVDGGAISDAETKDSKIPLTFAAHFNHIEVLSFLLNHNHDTEMLMEDPKFLYNLMICGKLNNSKSLEEFILKSPAPAETAAKLSERFASLSEKEKERSKDLMAGAEFCEGMCADLVALAAVESSADRLLKSIDNHGHQFLDILIETEQKKVISHPCVQKYLSEVWMGGINWPTWKFCPVLLLLAIFPISWLFVYLPFGKRFFHIPVTKFFLYLFSHLYITFLLLYVSVLDSYAFTRTSALPSPQEWILLVLLSGLLTSELINPSDRKGIGVLKVVILFFGAGAICIHISTTFVTSVSVAELMFNRNIVLSLSTFFCFILILDFISIHHFFGPWTIVIMAIMLQLMLFVLVLCIFMTGFSCMITATYLPTQALSDTDYIPTIYEIFGLLYFSFYGLVSPDDLPSTSLSPSYAKSWGKILFGFHMAIDLVVLINILIAMMSNSYDQIQEECDIEWKFGRAKMIRNMKNTTPIPSPFILLSQFIYYVEVVYCKIKGLPIPKLLNNEYDELVGEANILNRRKSEIVMRERNHDPVKIESVVDWSIIARRYLAIRSVEEGKGSPDEASDREINEPIVQETVKDKD